MAFKTFIVHWSGPYTLDQLWSIDNRDKGNGLYLLIGKQSREKVDQIQYCGITKRRFRFRVDEKHPQVQKIKRQTLSIWLGEIVYPTSFEWADLSIAEHCFVYFWQPKLNTKLTVRPPKQVCFISQWFNCKGVARLHRPSIVKELPDLLWWDEERWRTGRLRIWPPS